LYRLERELELRAGEHGQVRLLVHNHRNGDLTNIDVRLEPTRDRPPWPGPFRTLAGTVTSRSLTQLPRGARLTIELIDITDRMSSLRPIAQKQINDLGPLPIPFELSYNPNRIVADRKYAVRATVSVHGVAALKTRQTYRVFDDGQQGRVHMVLERAR
jgi:hypothetical protein